MKRKNLSVFTLIECLLATLILATVVVQMCIIKNRIIKNIAHAKEIFKLTSEGHNIFYKVISDFINKRSYEKIITQEDSIISNIDINIIKVPEDEKINWIIVKVVGKNNNKEYFEFWY